MFQRVGIKNKIFKMYKFRTMRVNSPQVITHLIESNDYTTNLGSILRKLSLDGLQIYNLGDTTIVGQDQLYLTKKI